MKWQEKTKEQKQVVILLGLVGAVVVFALFQFVLKPLFAEGAHSGQELEQLMARLAEADAVISQDAKIRNELAQANALMREADTQYIAPLENPLSWVTEKIYSHARQAGIEVESVAPLGATVQFNDPKQKSRRNYVPYGVRVATRSGFSAVLKMIRQMEQSNPYLCVAGVSLQGEEKEPERHAVSLVLEWPMHAAPPPPAPVQPGPPIPMRPKE